MATFDHWICMKKNHNLKPVNSVLDILKGWGIFKYLGGVVRSKDCRIKKWRGNEFAVMLTTSLYYFVLLSENVTFEIKIVHIYPVFLIDVGV